MFMPELEVRRVCLAAMFLENSPAASPISLETSLAAAPTSSRARTLRRTHAEQTLHLTNSRNETAHQSFSALREVPMNSHAIEGACAFAWRNYLLLHSGISENDNRRSTLSRYVTNLRDTGEYDFDLLQIAAVAYLKGLDELHDDRRARLAADQALAEQLESRRAQPGT
jgi:hypothetical protein